MTIKAVLFDKDGTLLDFDATYASATAAVIADLSAKYKTSEIKLNDAMGYEPSTNSFADNAVVIAGSVADIAETVHPLLQNAHLDSVVQEIDELYRHHTRQTVTPFPFTRPTLDRLSSMNIVMGVGTNDAEGTAREHIDVMELTPLFHSISGYDSGYGAKPGGGMVKAFADDLGLNSNEVMMVGDSSHDCIAGTAAGAVTVGVTSGHYGATILAPVAEHVLPNISFLPELIQQLNGVQA